jgi:hypothetical protein
VETFAKIFWLALILGAFYVTYISLRWLYKISASDDDIMRDPLKSITVTFKPEESVLLTKGEIKLVTNKLNEKLVKPFGSVSKPIDIKDIVSISTLPIASKGVVQFTIWYREKYKPPRKTNTSYTGYNIGRTGGSLYNNSSMFRD